MIALNDPAKRLRWRQWLAVFRINVSDPALGHGHQRQLVNAVLPREKPNLRAAAQQLGLEAGLAVKRDDATLFEGAFRRPQFFDNADTVVRDVTQSYEPEKDSDPGQDCGGVNDPDCSSGQVFHRRCEA